jgi:hypothetical protein
VAAETKSIPKGGDSAQRRGAEDLRRFLHRIAGPLDDLDGLNLAGAKGNAQTFTLTTPINFVRASNTTHHSLLQFDPLLSSLSME